MRNIFVAAAAFVLAGCASGPSTAEQKQGLAQQDLAMKVREICENYNRVVDIACQEIERKATDPARKRISIQFRIYTRTYTRQAIVNPSPFAGFLDLWVMALQRRKYIETHGEAVLGDLASIAGDANKEMVDYIGRVADRILPAESKDQVRAEVAAYADAHPITGNIREWKEVGAARGESVLASVTKVVPSLGIKATAASIADVSRSVDGVGEVVQDLPWLARWNAQMLLIDLDENPSLMSVRESIRSISADVTRFNDIVEKLPERVQAEVGKTLDDIDAKQEGLRKTLEDAKGVATEAKGAAEALEATVKQAETTLASAERATSAFAAAGEKWEPVMAALLDITGPGPKEYEPSAGPDPNIVNLVRVAEETGKMAGRLQQTLVELRGILEGKAMDQLNANARGTIAETAARLDAVIDHAAWRGAQLAAGIAVLVLLYRLAAARLVRR
ncbi:MAG TPA: hypothetical protein VFY93_06565 [Planctomycetota bacterium]|nr:hypothetical protein [Planctomycetota bacterium]